MCVYQLNFVCWGCQGALNSCNIFTGGYVSCLLCSNRPNLSCIYYKWLVVGKFSCYATFTPTTFWVLSQLRNLMHLKVDANLTCTNMTHELWYWDYCSLLSLATAPLLSNLYILLAKSQFRNKRSSAFDIISLHPPNNLQLSKAGGMVFTLFKLTTKWEISKLFFKICTTKLLCVQILGGRGVGVT